MIEVCEKQVVTALRNLEAEIKATTTLLQTEKESGSASESKSLRLLRTLARGDLAHAKQAVDKLSLLLSEI